MADAGLTYRCSPLFVEALTQLQCTLLVSTGSSDKLISIGVDGEELVTSVYNADRPTGVATTDDAITVAAGPQVWRLADNSVVAPALLPEGRFDGAYLVRSATVTGNINCHELVWCRSAERGEPDQLWLVNTSYSCLATLDSKYSFTPRWRPSFITDLAAQDRCHLTGLALREGSPAYVSACAETDEAGAWRAARYTSGVLLDVATDEVVSAGLAMPHSPRYHGGQLLVLNSGHGTLESVDQKDGKRTEIESFPGVARGLACHGNVALVGLSLTVRGDELEEAPVTARHRRLRCGIGIVDLNTGQTVASLEFVSGVQEVYDVQVLPGKRCISLGPEAAPGEGSFRAVVPTPPSSGLGEAVSLRPQQIVDAANRGVDAFLAGDMDDAVRLLRRASNANPKSAKMADFLGNAFLERGDFENAAMAYRRALAADPEFAPALMNLGQTLVGQGHTDEGVDHLRRSLAFSRSPLASALMATALPIIYRDHDHVAASRHRLELGVQNLVDEDVKIDLAETPFSPPFYAAYQGYNDRDVNRNLGSVYIGADLNEQRTSRDRASGKLRIGFVSAYFRNHTIGRLNLGRVQHLDRSRFEVMLFASGQTLQSVTEDFERAADRFIRIPKNIATARQSIAEQNLDLLFFTDVGMDTNTYALAFSRMAPVQAVTWGHPVTTGSPTIDYFVSSELLEIAEADAHYTEQLVRLPSLGTYYHRPQAPAVNDTREVLGLPEDAHVYACPQSLFKFHPDNDLVFGEILRRDPKAVVVLIKSRSPEWHRYLSERFERSFGDVADRVVWLKALPHPAFMALLATADVALDPLVFGGGNSTYETLAVGTPVVTLPSEFLRGRITLALYRKMGFEELVCGSIEEYIEKALRLAKDADYRAGVIRRINETAGVLFEDESELRDLEAFFETAIARS